MKIEEGEKGGKEERKGGGERRKWKLSSGNQWNKAIDKLLFQFITTKKCFVRS